MILQRARSVAAVVPAAVLVFSVPAAAFGQGRGTVVFRAEPSRSTSGLRDALEVTYTLVDLPKLASLTLQPTTDFTILPGQADRQSTTTDLTPQGPVQSTTLARIYILQPRRTGKLVVPVAIARTTDGRVYRSNAAEVTIIPGSAPAPRSRSSNIPDPFGSGAPGSDPLAGMPPAGMPPAGMPPAGMPPAGMPPGVLPPGFDPWEQVVPNPSDVVRGLPRRSELSRRLFLEILPSKRSAWVGEPVTVRYRLTGNVDARGSLTKLPTPDGFWVQELATTASAPEDTSIGGQWYQALLLKRSAFIPQRAGTLVIDPAEINASTEVAGAGGMPEMVQVHLKSAPVSLAVRPLPAGAPASFTGAVGRFRLTAKLDHNRIGQDGTAVLTLLVEGTGNLTQIEPPTLTLPDGVTTEDPGVQDVLTPDAPTLQGRRLFTYTLTPAHTGSFPIPAQAFSFFDPEAGQYRSLQTQPLTLDVIEGAATAGTPAPAADAGDRSPVGWITGGLLLLGGALWWLLRPRRRAGAPKPVSAPVPAAPPPAPVARHAVPAEPVTPLQPPGTLRELLPQLRRGLDARLGQGTGYLSEDALRQRLEAAGWDAASAQAAPGLLRAIETALYGGGKADPASLLDDAQALWRRLYQYTPPS